MEFSRTIHKHVIRSAAILTTSYVAGTVMGIAEEYNTLGIELDFTKGSLTSLQFKIEVSYDGTNYYQQVTEATSGGTVTATLANREITVTGKYAFITRPVRAKYVKVSVKGTGTLTSSSCAINGYLSWS